MTRTADTSNSQWGNLIVLAACFKNDILHRYIEKNVLSSLFSDTIDFFKLVFKLVSVEGSALKIELDILIALEKHLFAHDSIPAG